PKTDAWTKAAPMPTARSGAAGTVYKGMILVTGGECDNKHTFTQNEAYDPKTDRWMTLASPGGSHGAGAAAVGKYAYLAGGNKSCGGENNTTDELLAFSL
ncbi:MAG TPA: kelch repeat-containing protein, partial [Caulobacteraceae bacterium]|nr:kelch repeat-containing protein [Caulobacteraceae bacterium]